MLDTLMTVGTTTRKWETSTATYTGYFQGSAGALAPRTFFYNGAEYPVTRLTIQSDPARLCFSASRSINRVNELNHWHLTVKDKSYHGGWFWAGEHCGFGHSLDGLTLKAGERVAVTLANAAIDSSRGDRFDATITVGTVTSFGSVRRGYLKGDFGVSDPLTPTFTLDGQSYELEGLFTVDPPNSPSTINIRTTPALTLDQVNALSILFKDRQYHGGWTAGGGDRTFQHPPNALGLTVDEQVAVRIEGVPPAQSRPPSGFTATQGSTRGTVALAWTGPDDSRITKWQYVSVPPPRPTGTGATFQPARRPPAT